jgi:hypothetical protein
MGLALALIHLALQVKAVAIHASTPGPGRVGLGGEAIQVVALGDDDRHGAAGLDATLLQACKTPRTCAQGPIKASDPSG